MSRVISRDVRRATNLVIVLDQLAAAQEGHRAAAQRAELHVDVSDETFATLAARYRDTRPASASGCLECGHECPCSCNCGCCEYPHPLPAVS